MLLNNSHSASLAYTTWIGDKTYFLSEKILPIVPLKIVFFAIFLLKLSTHICPYSTNRLISQQHTVSWQVTLPRKNNISCTTTIGFADTRKSIIPYIYYCVSIFPYCNHGFSIKYVNMLTYELFTHVRLKNEQIQYVLTLTLFRLEGEALYFLWEEAESAFQEMSGFMYITHRAQNSQVPREKYGGSMSVQMWVRLSKPMCGGEGGDLFPVCFS